MDKEFIFNGIKGFGKKIIKLGDYIVNDWSCYYAVPGEKQAAGSFKGSLKAHI